MSKNVKTSSKAAEQIKEWQMRVVLLLYGAMILKAGSVFFPALDFPSGVLLFVFFLLEMFLLPPFGMAVMSILASVLFFFLPNAVQLLLGLAIGSVFVLFLGMAISAALSGIVLTFCNGVLISLEVVSTTAPLAIAMGVSGAVAGLGAAAGAGVNAAVYQAGKSAGARRRAVRTMLGSFLVFLVIGWPSLSYAQAISGALACKPAVILNQAHLNYLNYSASKDYKELFMDEKKWVFGNGFYADYINNGRNNISQGDKTMAAGDDKYLAVLIDGLLYVQSKDLDHLYYGNGYLPKKTDAMVLAKDKTFIFGHDRVFCAGEKGSYTWKETKWTSEFESLSFDAQCDRLYDILERQNTTESLRFSYEEVGVVAYAQRTGLLLNYDNATHLAFFAQQDRKGNVTVYQQSSSYQREEQVTFTPVCSGDSLPYVMVDTTGILYLKENQVKFLSRKDYWAENNHFTNPEHNGETHNLVSLNYMDLGEEGIYTVYLDEEDKICIDLSQIGRVEVTQYDFDSRFSQVMASAGDYIYSIQYEDSLLSSLTYLKDMHGLHEPSETSGWDFSDIWMEDWTYQRVKLQKSLFVPEDFQEPEAAEEESEEPDPESLYPAPIVSPRRSKTAPYDPTYITASVYATYAGPQDYFHFRYPERLYDNVNYTFENDGADIDIVFTCNGDASYLEVSAHPLPEDAEDIAAYVAALRKQEVGALYNGLETTYKEYEEGFYRFRLEGWTDSGKTKCFVNYHVDGENVLKMVLRYPNGTDEEDKSTKAFFAANMNYYCGFGTSSKKPNPNKY